MAYLVEAPGRGTDEVHFGAALLKNAVGGDGR